MSLVEIMIALVIGLILTAGVSQIYLGGKQTYRLQDAQSRLQENARYALELLTNDIRQAGYRGCASSVSPNNTLNNAADYTYNFTVGVQGAEWTAGTATSTTATNWSPTLDTSITNPSPGSDVITIRGPIGTGIMVQTPYMNTNSAALHITAGNGLSTCDIVMVTDCTRASILQITDANPDTSGTIAHNIGAACANPGNATTDLGTTYRGDAEIVSFATKSYYIGTEGGGGPPALRRRVNNDPAQELVEGVENMQILYGEDTDGDRIPNQYRTANNVINMTNVVAVRVSLLMRTLDNNLLQLDQTLSYNGAPLNSTSTPLNTTDRRLRHVFTTTVDLRNRSP